VPTGIAEDGVLSELFVKSGCGGFLVFEYGWPVLEAGADAADQRGECLPCGLSGLGDEAASEGIGDGDGRGVHTNSLRGPPQVKDGRHRVAVAGQSWSTVVGHELRVPPQANPVQRSSQVSQAQPTELVAESVDDHDTAASQRRIADAAARPQDGRVCTLCGGLTAPGAFLAV